MFSVLARSGFSTLVVSFIKRAAPVEPTGPECSGICNRASEHGLVDVSGAHVGASEIRSAEVRSSNVCTFEVCVTQDSVSESCTNSPHLREVTVTEISSVECRAHHPGTSEGGMTDLCAD
jgi:hypothetical protein